MLFEFLTTSISLLLSLPFLQHTLALPTPSTLDIRQSLLLPSGQGQLHLLDSSTGEAVGCLDSSGHIVTDYQSSDCYGSFTADKYSGETAAFTNEQSACTFSGADNSYTCSGGSLDEQSTFQEWPNNTLFNSGNNDLYIYTNGLSNGGSISSNTGSVKLMLSFAQSQVLPGGF